MDPTGNRPGQIVVVGIFDQLAKTIGEDAGDFRNIGKRSDKNIDAGAQSRTGRRFDFSGDAKPDILWQHTVTGWRAIWFMDGPTHTDGVFLGTVPIEWKIVR